MSSLAGSVAQRALIVAALLLLVFPLAAQESKTILGPANQELHDGAQALMARDAKEGVRLTLLGLQQARNADERHTAKANLCAGYALLEQYAEALAYCDEVLEENERNWRALSNRALIYIKLQRFAEADSDLARGEAINASAGTLRAVRRMYLDATNPVSPNIIIDDRRATPGDATKPDDD